MLIYLPLEKYEERYTAQLDRWVQMELEKHNIDYIPVYGEQLTETIDDGQVLDGCGRPHYTLTQMSQIMRMMRRNEIKSGDKIFSMDVWTHGLEAIPYAATVQKKNIDMYHFNCAGSFEFNDFINLTGMSPWAHYQEKAWFAACKKIFFAADTLRQMAFRENMFDDRNDKAVLTGLAFNSTDVYNTIPEQYHRELNEKEPIVVFPHRWDNEKRPWRFLQVAQQVKKEYPAARFVITTGRKELTGTAPVDEALKLQKEGIVEIKTDLPKVEYYKLLAKSKVIFSSALQDTVGNCMLESITHGCTPVATDVVSYHEYLPKDFLYYDTNLDQAVKMVIEYLDHPVNCFSFIERYDHSIENMLHEMELI